MENKFNIFIGCDCDPDRKRFNREADENMLSWKGFLSVPDFISNLRFEILKELQENIAVTYYVRADNQLLEEYGEYDYCFKLMHDTLKEKLSENDEIAWHHHHFIKTGNLYETVWDDLKWMEEHVHKTYASIKKYDLQTVHCGELILNTTTMNAYADVGIKYETSICPGTGNISGNYNRFNFLDRTSNKMYFPDRDNFLVENPLRKNILAIPCNTVNSKFLKCIDKVNYLIRSKKIFFSANANTKSFVPINAQPLLFKYYFDALLESNESNHLNTYFHADEVLPDHLKSMEAKLIFSSTYFKENISYVICKLRDSGFTPIFSNFKSLNC